jgi:hypothetical protein
MQGKNTYSNRACKMLGGKAGKKT